MTGIRSGAARRFAPAALALLWAAPSAAQPASAPSRDSAAAAYFDPAGLSVAGAIARGLAQEPSLQAARAEVEAARGEQLQAGLRPNPTISTGWRDEVGGMDSMGEVSVQLPLDLFRRGARIAAAERRVAAAGFAAQDRERRLAGEIRTRYGELLAAIRRLEVLDDTLALTRRTAQLLESRVALGAAPRLEHDVLRVDLQRMEAERLIATGTADAALTALKRAIGLPPAEPLKVSLTLEGAVLQDAETGERPVAARGEVPERPDVREAAARLGAAEAEIDSARSESRVDLSLFGGYSRMNSGFALHAFGPGGDLRPIRGVFHNANVGVMAMVPLFDRNQGRVAAAQARRASAERALEGARLSAAADIAAAARREEQARAAVRLYAAGIRDLARQNVEVLRETYELGRATLFDLLNEQRRFLEVETAFTQTLVEAFTARTALEQATGDVR